MQPIPYTLTNNSITVIVDGQPKVIREGGAQYAALRTALFNESWAEALELTKSPAPALAKYLSEAGLGAYTLDGTTLKLGDREVPADISGRIDAMLTRGESPLSLLRFFDRLQKNPNWRSVQQLFPFLQKENIPIEADGTFLTYKGVNANLTDQHTGTVDNTPGVVNVMDRNLVSDDPSQPCHYGFHVCSIRYLSYFDAKRTVICRVDPADVVCVPQDHSAQKMRVCRYEVVGHYTGQPLPSTTVTKEDLIDDLFDESEDDDEDDIDDESDMDTEVREAEEAYDGDGDNFIKEDGEITLNAEEKSTLFGGNIGAIKLILRGSAPAPRKGRSAPVDCSKLDSRKLLDQTIDSLRAYAAKLKIVGASKLPGGKVALVKQISKARRK